MEKPTLLIEDIHGENGNAFFILGRAHTLAVKSGLDWEAIKKEAMSGDYDNLLATMEKYFDFQYS